MERLAPLERKLEQVKMGSEQTKFKKFREKRASGPAWAKSLAEAITKNPKASIGAGTLMGGLGLHGIATGIGNLASPTSDVVGYQAYKSMFPGLSGMMAQIMLPEETLKSMGTGMGKSLGASAGDTLSDTIRGIIERNREIVYSSPRRKMIFETLKKEDELIKNMPTKAALEAYHSMTKHAPTLSLDKNAVKSFLRTVATSPEGGIDWNTIKGLADAENSILKAKETASKL